MSIVYVPCLKEKRGERYALRELSAEIKSRIKPILNILDDSDVSNKYSGDFFIDFHPNYVIDGTKDIIDFYSNLENMMHKRPKSCTPVIRSNLESPVWEKIKPSVYSFGNGVAIRVSVNELGNIVGICKNIRKTLDLHNSDIDIILDFGQIDDRLMSMFNLFEPSCVNVASEGFRSISMIGHSFPVSITKDLAPHDKISDIPREEVGLFNRLKRSLPSLVFGDYGSDDPEVIAARGRITMIPSIRYTTKDSWKIIRGHHDTKAPYDFSQYHELSNILIGKEYFCGETYSWGDEKIFDVANTNCANNGCNHGNAETWVKVAMNHHITYVANQCANHV